MNFFQAGQPRVWFSSKGKMLQLETQSTQRARNLADIYRLLAADEEAEGADRLPALAALSEMVTEMVKAKKFNTFYFSGFAFSCANWSHVLCRKKSYHYSDGKKSW